MARPVRTQEDTAVVLLQRRGMLRLSEFLDGGVTAATISRMEQKGAIIQLGRGLYQLSDAPIEAHHSLAVAAKLVPNGIICFDSALAFHELTDRIPRQTWVGLGAREWKPRITHPPIQIVSFGPRVFDSGWSAHPIKHFGVKLKVYDPAKTIVDLFRHGLRQQAFYGSKSSIGDAIRAMKEALRVRKATPAEIARFALEADNDERLWKKLQPYLETLTIDA